MELKGEALPETPTDRQQEVFHLFSEWGKGAKIEPVGEDWLVTLRPPTRPEDWVDPDLCEGLAVWNKIPLESTASEPGSCESDTRSILKKTGVRHGVDVSLSDAWSARSLVSAMRFYDGCTLLMVDDHTDLGRVWLEPADDGHQAFQNSLTSEVVDLRDPVSVESCINTGAVGFGGWLTSVLLGHRNMSVRRLHYAMERAGRESGNFRWELDQDSGGGLPTSVHGSLGAARGVPAGSNYWTGNDPDAWVDIQEDELVFVHIDADAFSNRYDWDSDWDNEDRDDRGQDPSLEELADRFDRLIAALRGSSLRVVGAHVALSPGFFPAEYWDLLDEKWLPELASLIHPELRRPDVTLDEMKTELSWHVFEKDTRAGVVRIEPTDDDQRWWISLKINEPKRHQGIGSTAFRLAALESGKDEIWARASKKNEVSVRALLRAGYDFVREEGERQALLRWRRPT